MTQRDMVVRQARMVEGIRATCRVTGGAARRDIARNSGTQI